MEGLSMSATCQDCGDSVAWGSGKFVNRIPADDWLCAECASLECDRCGGRIPLDEDIAIDDGTTRVCDGCLTPSDVPCE